MSAARYSGLLLRALRNTYGERAVFHPEPGVIATFAGRFRIDPFEVGIGSAPEGLNTTQTWLYCDRADIGATPPDVGDFIWLRDQWWEVVQVDADDIGEIAFRLIKAPHHGEAPAGG